MPNIIKGVTPLLKVYKGPLALQKIYKGAIPIWSSGPPLIPGVTYINQQPVNSLVNWFPDAVGGQQLVGTGLQVFSPTAGPFYNSAYINNAIPQSDFVYYDMRTGAFFAASNTAQFMFGNSVGGTEAGNITNVSQNTNYTGWVSTPAGVTLVTTFFGTANEGSIILNKFRLVKPARYLRYGDDAPANDLGAWVAGSNTTLSQQADGIRLTRNTSSGIVSAILTIPVTINSRYGLIVKAGAMSGGASRAVAVLTPLPGGSGVATGQIPPNATFAVNSPGVGGITSMRITYQSSSTLNSGNYVTLNSINFYELVQP